MKYLMLLFTAFLFSCTTETTQIDLEQADVNYIHFAMYVDKKYVKPGQRELVNLQRRQELLKSKINSPGLNSAKEIDKESLEENQRKIEVIKIWEIYHKTILISGHSLKNGDQDKTERARQMQEKLKARYKDLTGEKFPNVEEEFRLKYGHQLEQKQRQEVRSLDE